jgi:hypothetical protein
VDSSNWMGILISRHAVGFGTNLGGPESSVRSEILEDSGARRNKSNWANHHVPHAKLARFVMEEEFV